MSDDPETPEKQPWQPPDWLRAEPSEWRSRSWDDWVARDSPFAPKPPDDAPPPEPPPPPVPTARTEPVEPPAPAEPVEPVEQVTPSEPPEPAEPPVAVLTFRARAWESLGLEPYDWLTDDQVARLVTQDRTGRVVDGPTFRQLERELLGDPEGEEPSFTLARRTRPEPVNWVARGLLVFFAMILLSPLGIWAVLVALVLLFSLFSARRETPDSRRGILEAYRAALEREHRRDPE